MHRIAERVVRFLSSGQEISDVDFRKYVFGLECFLSDFSKLLLYIVIFASLSMLDLFAVAFVFSAIPRQAAGGWHAKTYWSCFTWTLLGLLIPIMVAKFFPVHLYLQLAILVATLMIVAIKAPRDNRNKPIISPLKKRKLKIVSILIFVVFGGIAFYLPEIYSQVAIPALAMEGVSLLPHDRTD